MKSKFDVIMGIMMIVVAIFVYILTPEHYGVPLLMLITGISFIVMGIKGPPKFKKGKSNKKTDR
ncbi:hypothetical protein [Staphylococcus americanisciuri]|uniref:Uncharacterized protein n=1 Tax=Staphylococcus americanisciuri TaxID=2973940 RepID=A0ABT2F299_9STAP|nr:hypothetical protein [Staphylococcus americanisciuri]MCS4486579.1 hypothetical protein [Staphylococcus americanisciuri]